MNDIYCYRNKAYINRCMRCMNPSNLIDVTVFFSISLSVFASSLDSKIQKKIIKVNCSATVSLIWKYICRNCNKLTASNRIYYRRNFFFLSRLIFKLYSINISYSLSTKTNKIYKGVSSSNSEQLPTFLIT